jgi:hypothetical protein
VSWIVKEVLRPLAIQRPQQKYPDVPYRQNGRAT